MPEVKQNEALQGVDLNRNIPFSPINKINSGERSGVARQNLKT